MYIVVIGLNHKTAPVEVREKLAFPDYGLPEALERLRKDGPIAGCTILSTCNRTEIYAAVTEVEKGINAIKKFLGQRAGAELASIGNYLYTHSLYDAIRHLFRVAAGLDSMILGETQILGQVRHAYEISRDNGASNSIINTLFQQAITVGKRVRTETEIDRHAVSISYAAVELARQIFQDLQGKAVLILGAGKMSELTAKHLVANGMDTVMVANRSYERADCLAQQFGGNAIPYENIWDHMEKADIVISATSAPHYVILPGKMEKVMEAREGKQIFLIDIAVPRDIDPEVRKVTGVALYDIDDLQNVVDRNLEERRKEAGKAETIVEDEITGFLKWLNSLFVVPTIMALKAKGEAIKQAECDRVLAKLGDLTDKEKKLVTSLASSIVNQILHEPIVNLREYAATQQGHLYSEILQNLFNLRVEGQRHRKQVEETREQEVANNL